MRNPWLVSALRIRNSTVVPCLTLRREGTKKKRSASMLTTRTGGSAAFGSAVVTAGRAKVMANRIGSEVRNPRSVNRRQKNAPRMLARVLKGVRSRLKWNQFIP